jgi:hypothetical protein
MKKVYLIALINLYFINLNAQYFDWAKREGLWEYDYGYGIQLDNSGNILVAGKFEQNANFSGTTINCQGNHDIYVAKYAANGDLIWIKTAGGPQGDYAHALSTDGTANIYVAGEIEWSTSPTVFEGSSVTLTSLGDNDIVVANYDMSGNLKWAKSAGGGGNDRARAVANDAAGNVYIAGMFTDNAAFGSSNLAGVGPGTRDIFVAKYDANGNFLWAKAAGGSGRDEAHGIKCDAAGNVYVCGFFSGTSDFSGTSLTAPNGYFDAFLAKYDPSGNLMWVKQGGDDYDDVAWSVTVDNAGKIYVAGEFIGGAMFGGSQVISNGSTDVFVACYDNSGTVLWAKGAGGSMIDRARGINTNGTDIFITGQFGATATFGSKSATAADSSDIFIAGLDPSGNFTWLAAVGGGQDSLETLGYESGDAVCGDASGNVYATGALLNGGTFGSITLTGYTRTDMFLTKLSAVAGLPTIPPSLEGLSIYPNPASSNLTVDLKSVSDPVELKIRNCLGQIIESHTYNSAGKSEVNLSGFEKGIYFLEVRSGDHSPYTTKLILQ